MVIVFRRENRAGIELIFFVCHGFFFEYSKAFPDLKNEKLTMILDLRSFLLQHFIDQKLSREFHSHKAVRRFLLKKITLNRFE